jgi:hypothetical protein
MDEINRRLDGALGRVQESEAAVKRALKQPAAQRQDILRAAFSANWSRKARTTSPPACCWTAAAPNGWQRKPPRKNRVGVESLSGNQR